MIVASSARDERRCLHDIVSSHVASSRASWLKTRAHIELKAPPNRLRHSCSFSVLSGSLSLRMAGRAAAGWRSHAWMADSGERGGGGLPMEEVVKARAGDVKAVGAKEAMPSGVSLVRREGIAWPDVLIQAR
eukprot:scaffold129720_cov31-Prasinocladus_malaysianus.AAC.1